MTQEELDTLKKVMSALEDRCVDIDSCTWGVKDGQLYLYPKDAMGAAHSDTMMLCLHRLNSSDEFINNVEKVINSWNTIASLAFVHINR